MQTQFLRWKTLAAAAMFLAIITACATAQPKKPAPDLTQTVQFESALLTATYGVPTITLTATSTATAEPTRTPTPTPTPIRTPPVLSPAFQTDLINPKDIPAGYIPDTCQYLRQKWDPNNSEPGTVVMPIMFHSITDGVINHEFQVTAESVKQLLHDLKIQGFETITMQELAGFLQHNAKIPTRSVLLIVDDLHTDQYYRQHFVPLFKEYGWSLTNAWISSPEDSKRVAEGNIALQKEGWVDHQAHGVIHNINIAEYPANTVIQTDLWGTITADEFARKELEGSMKMIADTFGKAPIAYIWPGGNFSKTGVQIAAEVGYQLGFTTNPRGPLMFNWIPQADTADPNRPSFNPEGYIHNPVMLLPRFWDSDARYHIDTVRQISKAAAEYANQNRINEITYYEIICQPQLGPIPTQVAP